MHYISHLTCSRHHHALQLSNVPQSQTKKLLDSKTKRKTLSEAKPLSYQDLSGSADKSLAYTSAAVSTECPMLCANSCFFLYSSLSTL